MVLGFMLLDLKFNSVSSVTIQSIRARRQIGYGIQKGHLCSASAQDNETSQTGNGVSTKGDAELDPSPWSKVDKSGYIAKEVLEGKSSIRKRKSSTLGSKIKRFNGFNVKIVLSGANCLPMLFFPPNGHVLVIHGILKGSCILLTFFVTSAVRSLCSVAQELTAEQLEDLLPSLVTSKRSKDAKKDIDRVEALEGLDTLANLAILGEGEAFPASSQATTKHPRHRPGCSCIVCIQPPSGKGPKHKQTCTCNVCQTVKRRFKTLMMKREKKQSEKEAETKQSEKEAETTRKKQQEPSAEKLLDDEPSPCSNTGSESGSPNKKKTASEGSDDDPNRMKSSTSPFKGQIDLNIQPEREDELSPGSDSGGMMRMLQDATETYLRMQKFLSSDGDNNPSGNHMLSSGGTREKVSDVIMLGSSHQDADKDHPPAFSMNASASTPATG
ncbi:hypothetical protein NC653_010456 [Populus alba x Populus x berolinensis]|uniref:Uncharacterized protein n=1 Tax=Populus alba x Populus x berolinensis TaxID=444605 RepID=A0AAD6R026_9ROSI|nr:hypothetical protein NC653_010456 [Populus alba x Populus x berolinensis]